MKQRFSRFLMLCLVGLLPVMALASEAEGSLDSAPPRNNDLPALQRGGKLFVNYCLSCHSASMVRYNRLQDIGLTPAEIKDNLIFTTDKVGDTMNVAMKSKDAKDWFGVQPPDLSLVARARGADWLYTYLRSFYRDDTRPSGWNNLLFHNVGMPNVLWELQGIRTAEYIEQKDPHDAEKTTHVFSKFETVTPGKLSTAEYDATVADLVGFLEWMGEPLQNKRKQLGVWVLMFLAVFWVITWRLNAAYWKDIK